MLAEIGPGSYELPSVWDDHATTIGGQDRFQAGVFELWKGTLAWSCLPRSRSDRKRLGQQLMHRPRDDGARRVVRHALYIPFAC